MNIGEGIILGAVQGLTEFLPVSSTGHLILARELLGMDQTGGLAFDALLHLATALAVIIYFRNDWRLLLTSAWTWLQRKPIDAKERTLLIALMVGTVPAVVLGLVLSDPIETMFRSPQLLAGVIIVGSILMTVAEWAGSSRKELTAMSGFLIGWFQALALFPGMSRSGATISGGLLLGLTREEAARFAFLLSLPVILGAGTFKALDLFKGEGGAIEHGPIIAGAIVAFGVGMAAIHFLMRFLKTHSLMPFVAYRLLLAGFILLYL